MIVLGIAAVLVVAGIVALRLPTHAASVEQRRETLRALRRFRTVVEEARTMRDPADRTMAVIRALVEVLRLEDCWYEASPISELPELEPDGTLTTLVQQRDRRGIVLPCGVAVPDGVGGRYVIAGNAIHGTTLEERVIAALIAISVLPEGAAVDRPHSSFGHKPSPPRRA
jgi:hypothetical protein